MIGGVTKMDIVKCGSSNCKDGIVTWDVDQEEFICDSCAALHN